MADVDIPGFDDLTLIGRGSSGAVYRGRQAAMNRAVAIKVLSGATPDPNAPERFRREVRILGELSGHPHIVTVYASGTTSEDQPYLVMDLMERDVSGMAPMAEATAVDYVRQAGIGLAAAHDAGVLHRDIKPDNIFVDRYGTIRVGDFGLVGLSDTATMTKSSVGSPAYMAPELLADTPASVSSDLYALAVSLYELIEGVLPFRMGDGGIAGLFHAIVTAEPAAPTRMSAPVWAVVQRCLAKDPAARPGGVSVFLAELGAAASRGSWPPPAPPLAPPGSAPDTRVIQPSQPSPPPVAPPGPPTVHAPYGFAAAPPPGVPPTPPTPPGGGSGRSRLPLVLVAIGIVVGLVIGGVFLFGGDDGDDGDDRASRRDDDREDDEDDDDTTTTETTETTAPPTSGATPTTIDPATVAYLNPTRVESENGSVEVYVPDTWSRDAADIPGAADSLFAASEDGSERVVLASGVPAVDEAELEGVAGGAGCTYEGAEDYVDVAFTGLRADLDCAPGVLATAVVAEHNAGDGIILVFYVVPDTDRGRDIVALGLASFEFTN